MTEYKKDQVLDHNYDGIQEYDNRLPNWWLYILYGSIVFAVFYWLYFQTTGAGLLPGERYEVEMVKATEAQLAKMEGRELTDEALVMMSEVPAKVASGKALFQQFCAVCHQPDASGNVGPNLTDAYWLHGGTPLEIHHTVTYGVPEKGMAAWGSQLGPKRVLDVVAFVLSIRNSNRPGKAPQGVLMGSGAAADSLGGGATAPGSEGK